MTVDEFKDWLRDGDTTAPVKHRAEGGRVHMADGGTPLSDADMGIAPATPAVMSDADMGLAPPAAPDQGALSALGHGAASGATFGFSDELRGVHAAAPDSVPEMV